jgi:hypothetical protein
LKKLGKDPVMILKILAIPPIAFRILVYFTGSVWPIFYFALGSITTIATEIILILWFFNKSKKEELQENLQRIETLKDL